MTNPDLTQILKDASSGSRVAMDDLLSSVYGELRRLAQVHLRDERPDHTLQPTALVHEAYLRLIDQRAVDWQNRAHFFAIASQVIRRILVDHARTRARKKRGGDAKTLSLEEALTISGGEPNTDLVALDGALSKLEGTYPEKSKVVELKFYGGLTTEEAAAVLDVSTSTIERHWQFGRAWLYRELSGDSPTAPGSPP